MVGAGAGADSVEEFPRGGFCALEENLRRELGCRAAARRWQSGLCLSELGSPCLPHPVSILGWRRRSPAKIGDLRSWEEFANRVLELTSGRKYPHLDPAIHNRGLRRSLKIGRASCRERV